MFELPQAKDTLSLLRRTLNVKGSQNELHKLPGNMTPFIKWWRLQYTLKGYPFIL